MSKTKSSSPVLASDVLQSLLQNSKSGLGQGFARWKLWREWEKVVGTAIATHSDPVGYQKGILYIWVESSPRMQEMIFLSSEIKRKINAHFGQSWVKRIRFTLDRRSVPQLDEAPEAIKQFLQGK